jgi:hypothetical protein
MIRREADLIADLAKESGLLEQRVMLGEDLEDPEAFLEELFQAWYVLLAVRTMATHSSATYGRMARLVRFLPDAAPPLFADIADQFEVIKTMADGQREFLHGVIEFYQTRTSTHLTIAARTSIDRVQQKRGMRRIPRGSRSLPSCRGPGSSAERALSRLGDGFYPRDSSSSPWFSHHLQAQGLAVTTAHGMRKIPPGSDGHG